MTTSTRNTSNSDRLEPAAKADLQSQVILRIACLIPTLILACLFCAPARGDFVKAESRTPHYHVIPLRDADGRIISLPGHEDGKPDDTRAAPFSIAETCGKCHEYSAISKGWHFNSSGTAKPGRPGEPWILADTLTHTQIPLSYRGWPGTFKPSDIGLSDFDFLANFARHLPGGGVGEPTRIDAESMRNRRFQVTGPLQIDCFLCHESDGRYDHEARYFATTFQDFKWSAGIGLGLGKLGGFKHARMIADTWRSGAPAPTNVPPMKYDRDRFDADNNISFQVSKRPPAGTCYYCHTSNHATADARWNEDQDVHIRAGMVCVDCHRNGVDHNIARGYEGEADDREIGEDQIGRRAQTIQQDSPGLDLESAKGMAKSQLREELKKISSLSCRGCHMGENVPESTGHAPAGRLGAPHPLHRGLPPIHLQKLACTACHSGPMPAETPEIVQTSLAHKLGIPAPVRAKNTPPVIVEPVFLRDAKDRITPNRMLWPSYWGYLKDGRIKAMMPEEVVARAKLRPPSNENQQRDPYNSAPLSDSQIADILKSLSSDSTNGQPVFVASGKLWKLSGTTLLSEQSALAAPYSWPIAHDVRPATQALGARGCSDCHSETAAMYNGSVIARGPVTLAECATNTMAGMRGDDESAASVFAFTFRFRPMLKIICGLAALVILLVIASHGLDLLKSFTGSHPSHTRRPGPR